MTSLSIEIILSDDSAEVFKKEFKASDSNKLIYDAFMAVCPSIKLDFANFIKTIYFEKEPTVITNVEFNLKSKTTTLFSYLLTGISGKRSRVYGALIGVGSHAFDEIHAYLVANYT